jgi:hypothetical protein
MNPYLDLYSFHVTINKVYAKNHGIYENPVFLYARTEDSGFSVIIIDCLMIITQPEIQPSH